MCLRIYEHTRRRIAKQDIVVYKHILHNNNRLVTSFIHTTVEIGKTYQSAINKKGHNVFEALHSYKEEETARIKAKQFGEILVKCIIPKGSNYYVGYDAYALPFSNPAYASDKLKYVEIIKNYTPKE